MDAAVASVRPFFDWLFQTTLIGSIVVVLILAAQKTLGAKLGPRWGYALWLVLVVRLLLPGTFPGQIDLLDLAAPGDRQIDRQPPSGAATQGGISQTAQVSRGTETEPVQKPAPTLGMSGPVNPRFEVPVVRPREFKSRFADLLRFLPVLWLVGVLVMGVYLFWSNFFLWRIVKRERPLINEKILELFEECKERMGVQTLVGLILSARIKNPALFGFVRPRLLLPMAMAEDAGHEEMRYIFLHELAHLKHRDIYLGWLTSFLQILHWFNPLMWFAFHRLRDDRELFCDALVLSRSENEESQRYGQAIVGLLRRFSRTRSLPAMAGILENRSQLKRRITMIAHFDKRTYRWSPLSVFSILALGVVSLSFTVWSGGPNAASQKPEPGITLRRIETGPMSDFSGPPSLDGRYICDIHPTSDVMTAEIVVRDLTSGEIRPLTKVNRAGMWDPIISPGSTHVAYMNRSGRGTELQLIKFDGTGHRAFRRFEGNEEFYILSWTPDGLRILGTLWNKDEDPRLVAFAVEDGSMQVLHTFVAQKPAWYKAISPDGRYLAFERTQDKNLEERDIDVLDIARHQVKCVVQHAAHDRLLGWASDSRHLFFASDRKTGYPGALSISDTWDAYLLEVADGEGLGAPEIVKRDIPAKIRPKGFTRNGDFYYAIEFSAMEVGVAEVDLQSKTQLKKSETVGQTGTDVAPAWSPDGRSLAYGVQRSDGSQTIRIRNIESGRERTIDPKLPHFLSQRWSPDGKYLLASTFRQNSPQMILRIDSNTGERKELVQNGSAQLGAAQLSRDGRTLFYVLHHPQPQKASLMARDMESGREKELFGMEHASNVQGLNFALSPDGRQLALATFEVTRSPMTLIHRILTMPAEGGTPKELLKDENLRHYPTVAWTPDGQSLLFTNSISEGGRGNAVFHVPVGGGQVREICRPQTMNFGYLWSVLDIHPDGKRIAFDCYEYRHEVWAMENFLSAAVASKEK